MTKVKKVHLFICSLLLVFTGLFFIGCGGVDSSSISLTADVTNLTMDIGEERNIIFTIENYQSGMSGKVVLNTLNSSNCIEYTASDPRNGTTTVTVKALSGGTTTLIAVTEEGNKECTVNIYVKAYSDSLANNNQKLYVSDSTLLVPSSNDFVFSSSSTERSLKYYFFGTTSADAEDLVLENVQKDGQFVNEFISASLIQQDGQNYVLFKGADGNYYTMRKTNADIFNNVFYAFIPVQSIEVDGNISYIFAEDAMAVKLGDRFTFIARYDASLENEIFVQRDFYVLKDIASGGITYEYGYLKGDDTTEASPNSDKITLIPNRQDGLDGSKHVSYQTIRLKVSVPTTGNLIQVDDWFDEDRVATKILLGVSTDVDAGTKTYTYQISSRSTTSVNTNLNIRFYYDGWEKTEDDSVNFVKTIPVVIAYEPNAIAVNNEKGDYSEKIYTFYNNYAATNFGWQDFDIEVSPNDCVFDYITVRFNNQQVMLRYNGVIQTEGTFNITDLSKPISIKGVNNEENVVTDGKVELILHYSILTPETKTYDIRYQIIAGAKSLTFADQEYKSQGIYVSLSDTLTVFDGIYADATFSDVNFSFRSGTDVVALTFDKNAPIVFDGIGYRVNIQVKTLALGIGTYAVALDNGTSLEITFRVIESLDSITVSTNNESGSVTNMVVTDTETTMYILNDQNFHQDVDVRLLANGNEESSAIKIATAINGGNGFNYSYVYDKYVYIQLSTSENGNGFLKFTVTGYTTENFKRVPKVLEYTVNIVSYSLIQRMNVLKTHDGKDDYANTTATYTYVYIGTSNANKQTAKFSIAPSRSGYLFRDPILNQFVCSTFETRFVYWTVSGASVLKNGFPVSTLLYDPTAVDNLYTIEGCGTFDTSTMTFTAFASAANNFKINLIAHVQQFEKPYSFSISISALSYAEVNEVALQDSVTELNFSSSLSDVEKEIVIFATPFTATDTSINVRFTPNKVTNSEGEQVAAEIFGAYNEGLQQYEGILLTKIENGTYLLRLNASQFVSNPISLLSQNLSGRLVIAATDWLDASGNVKTEYLGRTLSITINFENGTEENPFHLETPDDVININHAPNAFYEIATTIDMSGYAQQLPLNGFSGHLVGTNNYAKITDIDITTAYEKSVEGAASEYYYGLFSQINAEAVIQNVTFEGAIRILDVDNGGAGAAMDKSFIGLLTAKNYGTLTNIGINILNSAAKDGDSHIMLQGDAKIGLVAGENHGTITQDYCVYTDENSKFNGLDSHILVYMGQRNLKVVSLDKADEVIVGGVVGENFGSIIKTDNEDLRLYGYASYLAYANISLTMQDGDNKKTTNKYVGGAVGYQGTTATGFYGLGYGEAYKIGSGILVGGRIEGIGYVGGIAGKVDENPNAQFTFYGMTSRAFVRGYYTEDVGAITGFMKINATRLPTTNSPFAVQAIDDGRSGEEASMVIRYLENPEDVSNDVSINQNKIGFGKKTGYQLLNYAGRNSAFSYLDRTQLTIAAGAGSLPISNTDSSSYYGDYIEITNMIDKGKSVNYQTFFEKDTSAWTVGTNVGFGTFNAVNPVNGSDNVFYVNYFEAASLSYSNDIADINAAQKLLDTLMNQISPTNALYPIIASNGILFTSLNSDIISINASGVMQVKQSGIAKVSVSSLLNSNDSIIIYIKAVNYFNPDETTSIIYPDTSEDSVPVDESVIRLRGNNSVTVYVQPSYLHELADVASDASSKFSITKQGMIRLQNTSISLAPNTEITAVVSVTSPAGVVDENSIQVTINGQNITFSKKENSEEGTYLLKFDTVLRVEISQLNNTKNIYECNVNKVLEQVQLIYTKGANAIYTQNYESLTMSTSKVGEDYIIVDSPSPEDAPFYALYANGEPWQGNYQPNPAYPSIDYKYGIAADEGELGLFLINFSPTKSNTTGIQKFHLTVQVNKASQLYQDRYKTNIYGDYDLYIYASSDFNKMVHIVIHLENMNVTNITIDNFSTIDNVETVPDYSTSSDRATPGKTGLLILNLTPEDADFDYLLIQNTAAANLPGNGKATFNLIAKTQDGDYDEKRISGSSTANGLKLNLSDIVQIYGSTDENGKPYEAYRGVVYVNYLIGTNGVEDGKMAEFKVSAFKDNKEVQYAIKSLTMHLSYHAYVTLENKTPLTNDEAGIYVSYNVARGLKYELNLDYYGFNTDSIILATSDTQHSSISIENGKYYLNIASIDFDYSNCENGYPISIYVTASQMEGEISRTFSSITKVYVLEYVIDYRYNNLDILDLVKGTDQGVLSVQLGNRENLSLDLGQVIEYDETNVNVQAKVEAFNNIMAQKGEWNLYTNLNEAGISTNQSVTTKNYVTKMRITDDSEISNFYFNASGRQVTPVVTHRQENSFYMFSYEGCYQIQEGSGVYTFSEINNGNHVYSEFKMNVYQSSSTDSPIPIDNYKALTEMQDDAHYILMADITLEPNFNPITAHVASFDGNGFTIYYEGSYSVTTSNIGLFESIQVGSMIKNVTLALSKNVSIKTSATSFHAGLLAGTSAGDITNCYVYSGFDTNTLQDYYFSVDCPEFDSDSYIAGIVGQNSGNITNSRSSLFISGVYNVAGLVGDNTGNIASSYYKAGQLIGNTQSNQNVAGFVVKNGESGKIINSYVSGNTDRDTVFSRDTSHFVSSTTPEAGFVYNNRGDISDCYSNIKLLGSSTMAGFVHNNGGNIANSFSLSVLVNRVTSSAGFAMSDISAEEVGEENPTKGTFNNCYYFYNTNEIDVSIGEINSSLANVTFTGVSRLQSSEFADLNKYFKDFAYINTTGTNAVWFYSNGTLSESFGNVAFNAGRLELVAPNIIAYSQRELLTAVKDEATGNVIYTYKYTKNSPALGTQKNPYIINNAEDFENLMLEPVTSSGFNYKNYRLISDINYSSYDKLSQLYNLIYCGSLEGNGFKINQIDLVSTESLTSAGMFAQIGKDAANPGNVMNLEIRPREISFSNANNVGALAGTLNYGSIYNVSIYTENQMTVVGNNFVGGIIGRTANNFVIKNVSSDVSAVAYYKPKYDLENEQGNSFNEGSIEYGNYSYAGGLIGYVGGSGTVEKAYTQNAVTIMGDRVGIAYGGVGKNATTKYTFVTMNANVKIKAYTYGGLVAGEVKGKLLNSQVIGNGQTESVFALVPTVPKAVGGIVGLLTGGTIEQAVMDQSLRIGSISTGGTMISVASVGGIAGVVGYGDSIISQSVVSKDLYANATLGGAVGEVTSGLRLDQVAITSDLLHVSGRLTNAYVGGLVGNLRNDGAMISNSYNRADIEVDTYTYASDIKAFAGGLIGNGIPLSFQYCYSSGAIRVQLDDKRAVGNINEVKWSDPKVAQYKKMYVKPSKYDHVYYFGSFAEEIPNDLGNKDFGLVDVESTKNNANLNPSSMVQFKAKTGASAKIEFVENNIGTPTYQYSYQSHFLDFTGKSILNNLFGNEYYNPEFDKLAYFDTLDHFAFLKQPQNWETTKGTATSWEGYYYAPYDETKDKRTIKLDSDAFKNGTYYVRYTADYVVDANNTTPTNPYFLIRYTKKEFTNQNLAYQDMYGNLYYAYEEEKVNNMLTGNPAYYLRMLPDGKSIKYDIKRAGNSVYYETTDPTVADKKMPNLISKESKTWTTYINAFSKLTFELNMNWLQ